MNKSKTLKQLKSRRDEIVSDLKDLYLNVEDAIALGADAQNISHLENELADVKKDIEAILIARLNKANKSKSK